MKNLILDRNNYTNIDGKIYGIGDHGCNYPVLVVNGLTLTCTNGSTEITTTDNFYTLLGGSISNNNEPLYKYLVSDTPLVIEVAAIVSATKALLKLPFSGSNGTYTFAPVFIFGQPVVDQTFAIDSSSGSVVNARIQTLYGSVGIEVGTTPVALGSDPILVNFTSDFILSALNIEYETYELS